MNSNISTPSNVLLIGSCLSESLATFVKAKFKNRGKDPKSLHQLLVNHLSALPEMTEAPIESYAYQIIQPPLRGVLHEGFYLRKEFLNSDSGEKTMNHALIHINAFLENYLGYHTKHGLTTFVTGFIVPQRNPLGRMMPRHDLSNFQQVVRNLNLRIEQICQSRNGVYYVDLDEIASRIGKKTLLDDSINVMSHNSVASDFDYKFDLRRILPPFKPMSKTRELKSDEFLEEVWNDIQERYTILTRQNPIKMVIVDLDDTLWRGVLADDGIHELGLEGWPLGIVEALRFLKKRGVLLGIASKNDEKLIRENWEKIFQGRLQLEDFASIRINWNPKVQGIREILSEVNLLPGNILFIDDNPVEREAVRREFPEIRLLGEDLYRIRESLLTMPELEVPTISEESSRRTEMIQAQSEREKSKKSMSREEFLASLNLNVEHIHIQGNEDPNFERALELLNKTNQFNTTGRRWTPDEIHRFFNTGGVFHAFKVKDKFTEYGLVGLLLIQGNCITQFVMSCRVVGLDVENIMLQESIDEIDETELRAEYLKTEKNHLCSEFYSKNGFVMRDGGWVFIKPEKKKKLFQRIFN